MKYVRLNVIFLLFSFTVGCAEQLDQIHYRMSESDIIAKLGAPSKVNRSIVHSLTLKFYTDPSTPECYFREGVNTGDVVRVLYFVKGKETLIVKFLNEDPYPKDIFAWHKD